MGRTSYFKRFGIGGGGGDGTEDRTEDGGGGNKDPELGIRPDPSKLPELTVEQDKGKRGSLVEKLLADLKTDSKGAEGQGEEKVLVAEGLRPISARLWKRIIAWKFVDLDDLLQEQYTREEVPPVREGVLLVQSVESSKRKRKRICEFADWVEAFSVLVAVVSKQFPESVPGLMAYMVSMKEAQKQWGGERWLKYDVEFREKAEALKIRDWGVRDTNLWAKYFSGPARVSPQGHGTGGGVQQGEYDLNSRGKGGTSPLGLPRRSNGPCYPFNNKGACDRIPPCPFPHTCFNCGEGHPAKVCPHPPRKIQRTETKW